MGRAAALCFHRRWPCESSFHQSCVADETVVEVDLCFVGKLTSRGGERLARVVENALFAASRCALTSRQG